MRMRQRLSLYLAMAALVAVTLAEAVLPAQDAPPALPTLDEQIFEPFEPEVPQGTPRALIVCGLPGDADHHGTFAELVTKLHAALTTRFGVSQDNIAVLFGDEPGDGDSQTIQASKLATREELEVAAAHLRESVAAEDPLWVIVLGHCHYDSRFSWLNLPGPDIQQTEFAKLFENVASQRQMFFITTSASGPYVKPLSAVNRVVISATESDWETNETEFPGVLADLLTTPPESSELDVDRDGRLTLFDLYISTCRRLAQSYLDREFLATEHPMLDDNGDGRGTELQIDYLSEDLGGRVRRGRLAPPVVAPKTDGHIAKSITLPLTPAAAPASTTTPEAESSPSE